MIKGSQPQQFLANINSFLDGYYSSPAEVRQDAESFVSSIKSHRNYQDFPDIVEAMEKFEGLKAAAPPPPPQAAMNILHQLNKGIDYTTYKALTPEQITQYEGQFKQITGRDFNEYRPPNVTKNAQGQWLSNGKEYSTYGEAIGAIKTDYDKAFAGTPEKPEGEFIGSNQVHFPDQDGAQTSGTGTTTGAPDNKWQSWPDKPSSDGVVVSESVQAGADQADQAAFKTFISKSS